MKAFTLLLILLLVASAAQAQNFGNIPPQTVLGNPSTTAKQPAQPMPFTTSGIDIRQFGADPSGATSSAAALTAAIASVKAAGGGKIVLGGAGAQYAMHGVVVNGSAIKIECDRGVSIVNDSANAPALTFGDGVTVYNNDMIQDCNITQKIGVTPVSGNIGLKLSNLYGFYADNIIAFNLYDGILSDVSSSVSFDHIWAGNNLHDGVRVSNNGIDHYISNSHSDGNANIGWNFIDAQAMYLNNVLALKNGVNGIKISKSSTGNLQFFFNTVVSDTSGADDCVISDLNRGSFTNFWCASQLSTSVNATATGLLLTGSGVHDLTFNSLQVLNSNGDGVYIVNSGGMPTNLTFNAPTFGSVGVGNGRGGAGYGFHVDNAAAVIKVYGGQSSANATGAASYGAATTGLDITWTQGIPNVSVGAPGWNVGSGYTINSYNANGGYPTLGNGFATAWNLVAAGEADVINTNTSASTGQSFLFTQQTGANARTDILRLGTAATALLSPNVYLQGLQAASGNNLVCINVGSGFGALSYAGSLVGCVPSALRFKNPISRGLEPDRLAALRPSVWKYKDTAKWGDRPYVGLYADDVEKMDPRCVSHDKDGKLENYEDRCVIAYLVATVQQQQKEIAALRGKK